jgi:hypothetical protein
MIYFSIKFQPHIIIGANVASTSHIRVSAMSLLLNVVS